MFYLCVTTRSWAHRPDPHPTPLTSCNYNLFTFSHPSPMTAFFLPCLGFIAPSTSLMDRLYYPLLKFIAQSSSMLLGIHGSFTPVIPTSQIPDSPPYIESTHGPDQQVRGCLSTTVQMGRSGLSDHTVVSIYCATCQYYLSHLPSLLPSF